MTITSIFQIKKTDFQEFAQGHKVAGSGFINSGLRGLKATGVVENMEAVP